MKNNIFEDLFFGDYRGADDRVAKSPEYAEALRKLCVIEDDIRRMSDKNVNKLLNAYQNKQFEINRLELADAFRCGFHLAMKIFYE